MSAQRQQQQSNATISQSSTEGQRQVATTAAKQSGKYTSPIQIIDEIAKIKADETTSIPEKNKKIRELKEKMFVSRIEEYKKNMSKYMKTVKQDGENFYCLDMTGGTNPESNLKGFDTEKKREKAFIEIIEMHAKNEVIKIFDECKNKVTPAYVDVFKHYDKKEEIDKQKAQLKFQETQLVEQKERLDAEITKTTAKLQSNINLYNSLNKQEFKMATTKAQMARADLEAAIKNQNDKNLVNAQKATTDAIKKTGELMDKTMRESHAMTIAANAQNREAITSAIGETGRLIKISAEDAKKAAENASRSGDAIKSTLQALSEDSKKAAADAMTAAAEANKLSEKQLAKQEETKAAVTAMNEAVVAASDKAEYSATMLRSEIEKVGSELRDIKELLGNKLDTLAEAFKTDKTVEITPDILDGIFDNFLTCSFGYRWMMKKEYYNYRHDTDNETLKQLEEIYSRKFNRTYTNPSFKDYLQCEGAYGNGEGRHKLSLYDFNTMLKMNGLPQIDWSDPNKNNGVFSRFGAVASESYTT